MISTKFLQFLTDQFTGQFSTSPQSMLNELGPREGSSISGSYLYMSGILTPLHVSGVPRVAYGACMARTSGIMQHAEDSQVQRMKGLIMYSLKDDCSLIKQ